VSETPHKMCQHEEFKARVAVNRMIDTGRFMADITVECAQCGEPFRFVGVAAGLNHEKPLASIDGLELRAPIEPQGEPRLLSHASFTMPSIPRAS
jgi:hypothetical protein